MTAQIFIRSATPNDLPAIMEVEEAWAEEARADGAKFRSRLERFSTGFYVAEVVCPNGSLEMVATITSMPMHYSPEQLAHFSSWERVTNNGFLPEAPDQQANALYIVSGVIKTSYRGLKIFEPMVRRLVQVARSLGLRYVLAGAVLPGYDAYCARHGEVSAPDYCFTRKGSHLVDPLLAMYEAIGFVVPDKRHVLSGYFPDANSRDHAAIVVCDLSP